MRSSSSRSRKVSALSRPSDSQKAWLDRLATRYHESLDEATLSYLAGRGIDQDAAAGFRLGLVVDPDPQHEPFMGYLSIPFLTPTGAVYMRFRCLKDHDCSELGHGKYESVPGSTTHLYNVQALHDADTMVGVSEGELDAIIATLCGIPTVGVPGSNNWKPYYYRLFDDFERVLVFGDGDKAGRDFAGKIVPNIGGGESRIMPNGHDITSYVLEHGCEAFLQYANT